jgi:hypothetical protein
MDLHEIREVAGHRQSAKQLLMDDSAGFGEIRF